MFSLDVNASGPFEFYLLQALKVFVTVGPIALILVATFLSGSKSRGMIWLQVSTAIWLVVALLSRTALSSSVMHHYMSGHIVPRGQMYAPETEWYLRVTSALWMVEQATFVLFSIALFFVLRSRLRGNTP